MNALLVVGVLALASPVGATDGAPVDEAGEVGGDEEIGERSPARPAPSDDSAIDKVKEPSELGSLALVTAVGAVIGSIAGAIPFAVASAATILGWWILTVAVVDAGVCAAPYALGAFFVLFAAGVVALLVVPVGAIATSAATATASVFVERSGWPALFALPLGLMGGAFVAIAMTITGAEVATRLPPIGLLGPRSGVFVVQAAPLFGCLFGTLSTVPITIGWQLAFEALLGGRLDDEGTFTLDAIFADTRSPTEPEPRETSAALAEETPPSHVLF